MSLTSGIFSGAASETAVVLPSLVASCPSVESRIVSISSFEPSFSGPKIASRVTKVTREGAMSGEMRVFAEGRARS